MKTFWKVENLKKPTLSFLPFKNLFIVSFFINLATIAIALISQVILPPQIPLYYGMPQAENVIAPSINIVLPPILSFVFLGMNLLVSLITSDDFLKKTLIMSGFVASLFASITVIKIIFLVGSF